MPTDPADSMSHKAGINTHAANGNMSPPLFSPPGRSHMPAFKQQPFIIGIAGGTASGKTTVCNRIIRSLGDQRVVMVSLDEFYRDLTPEECANIADVDFDAPEAFDVESMVDCLDKLKRGLPAEAPVYDFVTSKRRNDQSRLLNIADVVVVEGILVLHIEKILERCNMKIFVDTDDDVRLARRIRRDTVVRGRDVENVLNQYTRFVKPAFEKYVLPSKHEADIIIPWVDDNRVAVDLITQHIRSKLSQSDLRRIYPELVVLESTMQIRGMHTKIRERSTPRTDFVFYADRLIRLIVEAALGQLPFEETTVTTPSGDLYLGVSFARRLCGVSIIRSGEAMERSLTACCQGIKIGKILIHRTPHLKGELLYEKLPNDIADRHVLLMDPILSTGTCAMRVIDLLITRRGVDLDKIILLTLMAAPEGLHKLYAKYPKLKVVTSSIEQSCGPHHSVRPGLGNFGDRYFGTGEEGEEAVMLERDESGIIAYSPADSGGGSGGAQPPVSGSPVSSGAPSRTDGSSPR